MPTTPHNHETPCAPTAPPPACQPTQIVAGQALCLESACGHGINTGDYCDEVTKEVICDTHSDITKDGRVVRPEPWPCQHTATPPAAVPA